MAEAEKVTSHVDESIPPPSPRPQPQPSLPSPSPLPSPTFTVFVSVFGTANLPSGPGHPGNAYALLTACALPTTDHLCREPGPELNHRTATWTHTHHPLWRDAWLLGNVPAAGLQLRCRVMREPAAPGRCSAFFAEADVLLSDLPSLAPSDLGPASSQWAAPGGHPLQLRPAAALLSRRWNCRSHLLPNPTPQSPPEIWLGFELLGRSNLPAGPMCILGPTGWTRHHNPLFGFLTGTRVHTQSPNDLCQPLLNPPDSPQVHQDTGSSQLRLHRPSSSFCSIRNSKSGPICRSDEKRTRTRRQFDFQVAELQLQGPVPPRLRFRYCELRPLVQTLFKPTGLRGKLLHLAMRHEHMHLYRFDPSTERGFFAARSLAATRAFLRLAHSAGPGRLFSYVLTLDAVLRFGQTGPSLGMRALGKHCMHTDMADHVAFAGEFVIRRLPPITTIDAAAAAVPPSPLHDHANHDDHPSRYELVVDNSSGTYRPSHRDLPDLRAFLALNLPGLSILALSFDDPDMKHIKDHHHYRHHQCHRLRRRGLRSVSDQLVSSEKKTKAATCPLSPLSPPPLPYA